LRRRGDRENGRLEVAALRGPKPGTDEEGTQEAEAGYAGEAKDGAIHTDYSGTMY
jgi:hypothetical protein